MNQVKPNARKVASLGIIARNFSPSTKAPKDAALIKRFALQGLSRKLLPTERVSNCLRAIVPHESNVQIMHDASNARAYYQNLRTCDNIWMCPVCAAKITERRRLQLQKAVAYGHSELGLTPVLATFTLAHGKRDALPQVLKTLKKAFHSTFSGRWYQDYKETYGLAGFIRATEVTHGEHGWHPHLHVLMFFSPLAKTWWDAAQDDIKDRWQASIGKLGAIGLRGVTCDIRNADTQVYNYIAKYGCEPKKKQWGLESELTKAPVKAGTGEHLTPFQLLENYGAGDMQAGALFVEYAMTFKGSHQLEWTNGLKSLLCVDEKPADDVTDEHTLLAELSRKEWYDFLRLSRDLRGELLALASKGDGDKVKYAISFALEHGHIPTNFENDAPRPQIAVEVKDARPRSENPFIWFARHQARVILQAQRANGIQATKHNAVQ